MKDRKYIAGAFRFQLEYEDIVGLLMDKSLYPDRRLFIRELLQNAIDACRHKKALWEEKGRLGSYKPSIVVWDKSDDTSNPCIVFQDNGTGMSLKIVEDYFMRIGRSYYRSIDFESERQRLNLSGVELDVCSHFGIGILSCFLVADCFEVVTYRFGYDPLHITIEGKDKYFIIKRLSHPKPEEFPSEPRSDEENGPPSYSGTRITVHLRPSFDVSVIEALESFAVNVDCDIRLYEPGSQRARIIPGLQWDRADLSIDHFPQSLADRNEKWVNQVGGNLQEVIVASEIPFRKWDFASHLRGRAWFWLLRGENNEPCPHRGYLRMTSWDLQLTGLPLFLAELGGNFYYESSTYPDEPYYVDECNRAIVLEAMRECLSSEVRLSASLIARFKSAGKEIVPSLEDEQYEGENERATENLEWLNNSWDELSVQERHTAIHAVESLNPQEAQWWAQVPGLPKRLLVGASSWAGTSIFFESQGYHSKAYHSTLFRYREPQNIALHSIKVPYGMLEWNLSTGQTRNATFLPFPGGIQLDARGTKAPIPVASRLFIDLREWSKIITPYARAAFRHAADLVRTHNEDRDWLNWFRSLLCHLSQISYGTDDERKWMSGEELRSWLIAASMEVDYFKDLLRYEAKIDGNIVLLERDQVIRHFGRWVSLSNPYYSEYCLTSANETILSLHTRRKMEDGSQKSDMETFVQPEQIRHRPRKEYYV